MNVEHCKATGLYVTRHRGIVASHLTLEDALRYARSVRFGGLARECRWPQSTRTARKVRRMTLALLQVQS